MEIEVPVVNAFVSSDQGGNPAGVVVDASRLSAREMQYIACKVGASETAFVIKNDQKVQVRFFTPTVEVPLCGHATIATWSYMLARDLVKAGSYTQDTLAGVINIKIDESGLVFMEQPEQTLKELLDFEVITNELGIADDWIDKTFRPQIVQHALMVGIRSKQLLNAYTLDKEKLLRLNKKYNFNGLHLFVMMNDPDILAAVRDFDPIVSIDEDAATGTINGSFLTYLRYYNKLSEREVYIIEQGEAMGQLSKLYGKFKGDRVWIGGRAQLSRILSIQLQK